MHRILKIIRNTHRHPFNQALHSIGAPFYAVGLLVMLGHLASIQEQQQQQQQQQETIAGLVAGLAMWLAAIAMFVLGHKIEGNVGSMTPVLLFRLLLLSSRKVARYPVAQRIHLLRA